MNGPAKALYDAPANSQVNPIPGPLSLTPPVAETWPPETWPPETWPEYLRRITGGQTQAQIADRIGVGRLSVCHWLHGKTRPKAETVIAVARVYRRSPVEALLAAGYLSALEADMPVEVRTSLLEIPAADLVAEVHRRLVRPDKSG